MTYNRRESDLKYRRTESGVISKIYSDQKFNSKQRGHDLPEYSKEEFIKWLMNNNFKKLFGEWKDSGFKKNLKPSVDRKSNLEGYHFDNMQLVTWEFNDKKGHEDRKNTIFNDSCKGVIQLSKQGIEIASFSSIREANRITGISRRSISYCCDNKPKYKSAGGFLWNFKG